MDNILFEIQDYVVMGSQNQNAQLPSCSQNQQDYKWSENDTKLLIDIYKKFKPKLGTIQIKTAKHLWKKIADELNEMGINVTPNNCSNRWRVIDRNYKKFIDNQNKTGRGRKYFEYEKEMEDIYGKKKNIYPEVLLDSSTIEENLEETNNISENNIEEMEKICEETNNDEKAKKMNTLKLKTTQVKRKLSVMEKLRLDRKEYYEKRLKLEEEKLKIMEKRNEILKEKNCNCFH